MDHRHHRQGSVNERLYSQPELSGEEDKCGRGCCRARNAACPSLCGDRRNSRKRWSEILPLATFTAVALGDVLFMGTICVLSIVRSSESPDTNASRKSMAYSIIALFTLLAFLFFTIDSLWSENALQLAASLATSLLILAWTVVSTLEGASGYGPTWVEWATPIMVVHTCCTVCYLILAYPVWRGFGWNA